MCAMLDIEDQLTYREWLELINVMEEKEIRITTLPEEIEILIDRYKS